jgi:tetratricopeptide (TPR) repeat protein
MRPLLLAVLLLPSLAWAEPVTASDCKRAAKEADALLVKGMAASAWAIAEDLGPRCAAMGLAPSAKVRKWAALSQDPNAYADERLVAAERVLIFTMIAYGPDHAYSGEWFGNLAQAYEELGFADLALPLWERALSVRERALGPDHVDTAATMDGLAGCLSSVGRYAEALPLYERSLAIFEAQLGPDHAYTATSLGNLALLQDQMGSYAQAEAGYRRALDIRERTLGPDHPDTATALDRLGGLLGALGRYGEAVPICERALAIREGVLGPDHPLTATSLDTLARVYQDMGAYDRALPMMERALAIREASFGPEHLIVAKAIGQLGGLYLDMGRFEDALAAQERALAMREAALGSDHPDVGVTCNDVANVLVELGEYAAARPLYERGLAIARTSLGEEHPRVGSALSNLAHLDAQIGAYEEALPGYERALALQEAAFGPDHPEVGITLNNLAEVHGDLGDYVAAKAVHERALAMREAVLGPDHPDTAISLNNLAGVYWRMGDPARALPLVQRALDIQERVLGPDHPDTLTTVNNLGVLYAQLGRLDDALPWYERALASTEKVRGAAHAETATSLGNLGTLLDARGEPERAAELHQRAVAASEAALGAAHPLTAFHRVQLASSLLDAGDAARALPLYEAALAAQEAALGPDHPDTTRTRWALAIALRALGRHEEAVRVARRVLDGYEAHLAHNLVVGSPAQQRAFLDAIGGTTPSLVSLAVGDLGKDRGAAEVALTSILRHKARSLDAEAALMAGVRGELDAGGRAALTSLRSALTERDALGRRRPSGDDTAWKAELAALDGEIDRLQADLAKRSAAFREATAPIGVDTVRAALPAGSALVEVVVYAPFDATKPTADRWGAPRYAAFVLRADGGVAWADLGPASAIDTAAKALRKALVGGKPWEAAAAELRALVLDPVRDAIAGAGRLYVAPDGELHLVPLQVMTDQPVVLLATGREALRHRAPMPAGEPPIVIAGVDYGGKGLWSELPGAAAEGRAVSALLGATPIVGAQATDAAVEGLRSPRVLHVATHGFFDAANPDDTDVVAARGVAVRTQGGAAPEGIGWDDRQAHTALWRSGLVLAGANAGDGEGYVAAAEVAAIDLSGTRLVVLSACETGLGAARAGQGVMGLRYALVVAGSRAQVLSLWKVDDAATQALMTVFYRELSAGRTAAEALTTARLEVAAKPAWAHPRFWAAFTLSGDPDVRLR